MPMHKALRGLLLAVFILALLVAGSAHGAPSGDIIYVKHDATGSNNGSSWTDAYTDLQDALGLAQPDDEIWVAQGVYYPAPNAIDRTATFELVDGVALYGGFAGTETERHQRDWEANLTVLSGDLDRNDTTDENGVVADTGGILGRNAYHVVTVDGVGETAHFDGFTVTAGLADGDHLHDSGGGMRVDSGEVSVTNVRLMGNRAGNSGGGMFNRSSSTLTNVTFGNNWTYDEGGGMYNWSSSTLVNVTFSGNEATSGGGMFDSTGNSTLNDVTLSDNHAKNWGGGMRSYTASPRLTNVSFSGNQAYIGGGMDNYGGSPTLNNVSFRSNQAHIGGGMQNKGGGSTLLNVVLSGNLASRGGGIYNDGGDQTFVNVTLSGNKATSEGGAMHNHDSSPLMENCILWANSAPTNPQIHDEGTSASYVIYSDIEGGYDGEGNINADPLFVAPVSADQAPTTDGNYRLTEDSPAIDAGTNDVVTVDTDLDGNPRIVDGTGDGNAIVDMGAYEFQIPLLTVTKQGQGLVTSTPTGIDCGNVCTAGFLPGTVVTLTATADPGWTFDHWSGECTGTGTCQVTMDNDKSVTAHFTQEEYTLEIDVVGQGDVQVEPDQDAYHHGNVVMLTATAEIGWTFESWTGDVESTDNPLELTIEGDTSLTATFTEDEYTLDVAIVGEGTVSKEPQQETYIYGDVVTLTATAEAGWFFVDWSGDVESTDNPLVLSIEDDTELIATFAQDQYTLTVSIVGEGSVEVEPDKEKYVYGDEVTLTPAADPGWSFDAWSGPDAGDLSDNSDGSWNLVMDSDKSVTATFAQDEYTLDVSIVGEGEVDVEPEQDTYRYGNVVTLAATADPGWTFAGWSGDVDSSENPLALTVQGDTAITATFTQDEYTLDVAIVGEGQVDINPEQDTYVYGDVITLIATPDVGWTFTGWTGAVESTDNPLDFVVEGDTVITATFTEEYKRVYLPLVLANH